MEKGILIVLYMIEVVKYYVAYEVFFKEKLKKNIILLIGVLVGLVVLLTVQHINSSFLVVYIYVHILCVIAIVQKTSFLERMQRLLILLFILSCSDAFFDNLLALVLNKDGAGIGIDDLLESLMTLIVVVVLFAIQKSKKLQRKRWNPQKQVKLVVLVVVVIALEIVMTIAGLDYVAKYIDIPRFQTLVPILCMFSYLGIEMLCILFIYIRQVNENMESLLEDEVLLQKMQAQYYESLLEREADTRKYRHDMANHLLCLNKFAVENDLTALRKYLGNMDRELQNIQKSSYDSGNLVLDVITSHYTEKLSSMIKINITGRIQIQLDEMKLCTVYANLLQNAVEELKRCEDTSFLEIHFQQGLQFCRITICNSLSEGNRDKAEEQLLRTVKSDRRNHGLGLSNAAKAVEELHGTLELKKEENSFLATMTLPLK